MRERCAAWVQQHPEEIGKLDKQTVLRRYGQRYATVFKALRKNNQRVASSIEAGRRALTYFCITGWFEVYDLVGVLFDSIHNLQTLQTLITELQLMSQQLPECKVRWKLYVYPADALMRLGQSKAALPFYQQAATEVENAQDWESLAAIYRKWAAALEDEDEFVKARATYLRVAEAERKAGYGEASIIGSELEAYRIDLDSDNFEQILPDIEQRLEKLRDWWQQYQQGQTPAQAPDKDFLLHTLISALDIAESAQQQLENWQACLVLLQETADLQQIRGDNEQEQAETRFNTYAPVLYLGNLDEAQEVLNSCLQVYKRCEDLTGQEQALSALADICNKRGDSLQAIALERQALAICERLDDPEDRASSHGNLANYLFNAGDYLASGEHRLAVLIYFRLTGNQQSAARQLNNHAIVTKKAAAAHANYCLPSVQDLLTSPEFAVLRHYMLAEGVDIAELQRAIDVAVK